MPLIAIEGVDGAGKGTQARMLTEKLRDGGDDVILYSFPRYETPLGKQILKVLKGTTPLPDDARNMILQSMMFIDRYDAAAYIERFLDYSVNDPGAEAARRPSSNERGRYVVCDRWSASAEAYGRAQGLDPEWLRRSQKFLPKAHLTIFLDVPEAERLRRKPVAADRHEADLPLLRDVTKRYHDMLARDGWVRVDGEGAARDVHERICQVVLERLSEL